MSGSGAFGEFAFGISPFGGSSSVAVVPIQGSPPPLSGTSIPGISTDQFRQRLVAMFPPGWAGADSAQAGLFHDFLLAMAGGMESVLGTLNYVLEATRLTTETSPELDLASVDFFGDTFPRADGQSDSDFASAIIANLFKSAATRPAISAALEVLTGALPRMLEPWNIFDTGVWDQGSYWDVDTSSNPGRWGDGSIRYQGFIETTFPQIPALGPNNPVPAFDAPFYWDVPGYFFGTINFEPGEKVFELINRLRAAGITIWVKLLNTLGGSTAPGVFSAPAISNINTTSAVLNWVTPTTGSLPFLFLVQYRPSGTFTFLPGPTTATTTALLSGLAAFTSYDVQIQTQNQGGTSLSPIVSFDTLKVPPTPATGLVATQVQATAITVTWNAPSVGTPPFSYTVLYRKTGTTTFTSVIVGAAIGVTILGLTPQTSYQIEVQASNL